MHAVNCVTAINDELLGANTDGPGFLDALAAEIGFDAAGRRAVVVRRRRRRSRHRLCAGEGGCGRSDGGQPVARARRGVAAALAGAVGRPGGSMRLTGADLVVNATSVGMGDGQTPFDPSLLAPGQILADVVYHPSPPLWSRRPGSSASRRWAGSACGPPGGARVSALDEPRTPVEEMTAAARRARRAGADRFEPAGGNPRISLKISQRNADEAEATGSHLDKSGNSEVTVALQGTLDTFALPDVLRLLASTKKTAAWSSPAQSRHRQCVGRRRIRRRYRGHGDDRRRGSGRRAVRAPALCDGSFTFETGTNAPSPGPARAVEPLLVDAERQLTEWHEIEAVVPSMEAWISLVGELEGDEILLAADRWKTIVAIGSGTSVAGIGHSLKLGELAVCRQVKELVELGLAKVSTTPMPTLRSMEPSTNGHDADSAPAATWDSFAIEIPGVDPVITADEPPAEDEASRRRSRFGRRSLRPRRGGGRSGGCGRGRQAARQPQPESG